MMIAENKISFCHECSGPIEYCFCYCPYCGDRAERCPCDLENSKDIESLPTTNHSKLSFLKQTKKPYVVSIKDNWWRLEKWQIGGRKFP